MNFNTNIPDLSDLKKIYDEGRIFELLEKKNEN